MAPTRTVRSKFAPKTSDNSRDSRSSSIKKSKSQPPRPKASETKSKRPTSNNKPKKKRVYTEAELGLPKLNTIVPIGVEKPKGKKKGKVFVDDAESMMTILAMVNADKEGQIESKMIKARHLEELREARTKEAEKKEQLKAKKFEQTKQDLKKKKNPNLEELSIRKERPGSGTTKKVAFA